MLVFYILTSIFSQSMRKSLLVRIYFFVIQVLCASRNDRICRNPTSATSHLRTMEMFCNYISKYINMFFLYIYSP